jgi:hypothetical protein
LRFAILKGISGVAAMKKSYQIGTALLAAFALVVVFQNCGGAGLKSASDNPDTSNKSKADEISSRYQLITEMAARDLSCATDADCSVVALGAKGCGGPNSYALVSTLNADIEQIEVLAIELEQVERAYNLEQTNVVGNCSIVMPPEVACVSNICSQ